MKILVCVKAIPQTDHGIMANETEKRIDPIMPSGYRLNAWDSCSVEAAVQLKERGIAKRVDVLTCGNPDTDSVVRRSMGMGADHGIHIIHDEHEEPDSLTVAKKIAETAQNKGGYDLILCGSMSEDRMESATGPMIASFLGLPFSVSSVEMEIISGEYAVRSASEMDGGLRQLIRLEMPALVTLQTGINTPRYPKLSAMLRANQTEIETISLGSFALKQNINGYRQPEASRKTKILQGSSSEKASEVIRIMKENGLLKAINVGG